MADRARHWIFCTLALLGLLLLAPCADADMEETERRLKAVGIDEVLQAEIQRSIHRAVDFLRSQQRAGGGFGGDGARGLGRTALCAFALRHAGTPRAMEGVVRARGYLFPAGRRTYTTLLGDVYAAGLALLFLRADRPYTEEHGDRHVKRLLAALADAQDAKSGWWAYKTPLHRHTGPGQFSKIANLSTTQFAALGLWAGQPFVGPRPTPVWRRHLGSILDLSTPGGSWPYEPVRWDKGAAYRYGPPAYPTGTYMGLASLILAEASLDEDAALLRRTREARVDVRRRADQALRRHAAWTLRGHGVLGFPFYSLYALEKACVFAGLERIQEIEWYRDGATRLVAFQGDDGGWSPRTWAAGIRDPAHPSVVEGSAFALLFLLRTSETLRPVTPSEIDTPAPVVTESEEPTEAPPLEAEPLPEPGVRLSVAKVALADLRSDLEDRRVTNEKLLTDLDQVGEAYAHLVADPGMERLFAALADRWRAEAEAALLESVALGARNRGRSNARGAVNRRAAEVLATTNRRASERLRRIVTATHVKGGAHTEVLGACFDALARLGDSASATWLAHEMLDTDQRMERRHRTELALRALARFEDLPGEVRLEATEKILRLYEGVERAAKAAVRGDLAQNATFATWFYWEHIRYDTVLALHALARDPRTDAIPRTPTEMPALGMSSVRAWFNDHKRPAHAPWYVRR